MKMAGYSENAVGLDLSNKLVIKVTFGDEIRKVPIVNDDITYDDLLLMMQRLFKGKVTPSDDVIIKYKDEDDDMITIADSADLTFAVQCHRILKITLYVNGQPRVVDADEMKHIKTELRQIRDSTTRLLDNLEPKFVFGVPNDVETTGKKANVETGKTAASGASNAIKAPVVDSSSHNREFDPLGQKYGNASVKQDSPERNFGGQQGYLNSTESRPDTPSSASSKAQGQPTGQRHLEQAALGEENIATIQPSVHQQVNAGHPQSVINGTSAPLPPQPPTHVQHVGPPPPPALHMFQQVLPPVGQPTAPESTLGSGLPGNQFHQHHPSGGYMPPPAPGANQPPAQQAFHRAGAPPPPQPVMQQQPPQIHSSVPPQPPAPSVGQPLQTQFPQQPPPQQQQQQQMSYAMGGYPQPPISQQNVYGQQQQPPPTSYPSAAGLPPPPSSTPGPGAPPVGPPPTSFAGGAPGANPFARGGQFQSGPYVRPGFSSSTY